jgi:hypothetical protein
MRIFSLLFCFIWKPRKFYKIPIALWLIPMLIAHWYLVHFVALFTANDDSKTTQGLAAASEGVFYMITLIASFKEEVMYRLGLYDFRLGFFVFSILFLIVDLLFLLLFPLLTVRDVLISQLLSITTSLVLYKLIYPRITEREEKVKVFFKSNFPIIVYGVCVFSGLAHSYFWAGHLPVNGVVFFAVHVFNSLVFCFVRINYGIGYSMGYHFFYNIPYVLTQALIYSLTG